MHKRYYGINEPALVAWRIGARRWFASITMVRRVCELDLGLTYNFKNPDTQYQNGIDFHFDWGMSQFLSKQVFVGFVGYGYQQLTDDSGAHPILGGFRSRVFGIGPKFGYLFPVGDMQGYLNLKAYGEFAAENRPAGWNTWLTFSISPMAPTSTAAPTRRIVTK